MAFLERPLAAAAATLAAAGGGPHAPYSFELSGAGQMQDELFGRAARHGWLGGQGGASFGLRDGSYVWLFGDSFSNLTADGPKAQGGAAETPVAGCNYHAASSCAMPTNSVAIWPSKKGLHDKKRVAPLDFHVRIDNRSGQPTSTLWAPGWGGRGRTPKTPACDGCSLWRRAETQALRRSLEECVAGGASGLQNDKGGCCSKGFPVCGGYCCKSELYFQPMTGVSSRTDGKVLVMANMGRQNSAMPEGGETYATYAIAVTNSLEAESPSAWSYTADRMPGTHVWPWSSPNTSVQFHSSIVFGHDEDQPDRVYILGLQGQSRVLARASLPELLRHDWSGVEFLCPPGDSWLPYTDGGDIPELHPLWESEAPEASLVYDESLGAFLAPEVDPTTKEVTLRVSPEAAGPYTTLSLGKIPSDVAKGGVDRWGVQSVHLHPELAGEGCDWVMSVVLRWTGDKSLTPPTGLNLFPRLVCVKADRPLTEPDAGVALVSQGAAVPRPEPLSAGAAPVVSECDEQRLQDLQNHVACSEDSDGCHTCRERVDWIVENNRRTLDVAYSVVAAEFPEDCSELLKCKEDLLRRTAAPKTQQAWAVHDGGAEPSAYVSVLVKAGTAATAALAAVTLAARRAGRRGPAPAEADEEALAATPLRGGTED